jgi:glycine amidinotransferase
MMLQDKSTTKVCSWNEWDPLKHVIVGRADGTMIQAPEPAVQRDWPYWGYPLGKYGPLPQEMVDRANEQLDNFVRILEERGIRVDRPTPLDFSQTVQTPDWVQKSMFGCMPPRDLLLTIGNEIVEATMSYRSRWFEYLCYRPLLQQYFKEDPNFRWEAAPKPRLTDRTYRENFWKDIATKTEEEQVRDFSMKKEWILTEEEPLFDAAEIGRFGKDLIIQRSTTVNTSGINWLRRHFPHHRIHDAVFCEGAPVHIDATFIPLRPGLIMNNQKRVPLTPELIELCKKNDWEIVQCAKPARTEKPKLSFCSPWLTMNLLILDPKTICVEAGESYQMEFLSKLGFDVIPVPFWDVAPFGGGLHCSTADVYREGTYEDYFPHQIPGY